MNHEVIEPDAGETRNLLDALPGRRIAVVGDAMLDAYLHGSLERISPEAPVPVFETLREEFKLGGAANVAACLAALGAEVKLCGLAGADEQGARLLQEAQQLGIDTRAVLVDPDRPTTCKTRVVARNQQVIRLDRETRTLLQGPTERRLIDSIQQAIAWADGVVLSDYAKGVLTPAVCEVALRTAGQRPVVVDPKKLPWDRYAGATVIKPNRAEAELFAGSPIHDHDSAARVAQQIADALATSYALLTRGAAGMTLAARTQPDPRHPPCHLPARPRELVDVTGAGDVVAATLVMALAAGAEMVEAAWLANVAAGIKVGKFGAASVTREELLAAVGDEAPAFSRKVVTRTQAANMAESLHRRGKRVVFTNGCFDLLHLGHVTCLERSRRLGDFLIVGVNSDASVRRLKGAARPLQNETDRAQIVASQGSVDAVVVFEEDTPLELIRTLRPDVLTKGADYRTKDAVVGSQLVENWGGRVVLIDLIAGRSTTRLVTHAA